MRTKAKSKTMKYLERVAGRPLTLGGLIESIRLGEEMSQTAFARKLSVPPRIFVTLKKAARL